MQPIFATAYLPPIAYFAELAKWDAASVEYMETFPKQTYRNRALIITANGLLPLSVPIVRTNGNHTLTSDIAISYTENWPMKHWRAIEAAYNASPYFLYYKDGLEKIILTHYDRLVDLNRDLLDYLMSKLKICCQICPTEEFAPHGTLENDYRNSFSIKGSYSADQFPEYDQVFEAKIPFQPNLSIIDLLFNLGPEAKRYLTSIKI